MDEKYCPGCFSSTGLRKILYGMPTSEPDPDIYVMAGCTSEGRTAQMQCIECEWEGTTAQVRKATRARRFITTGEDLKGITVIKMLRLSHEALAQLQASESWKNTLGQVAGFTAESVYGPEGKIKQYWDRTWESPEQMRADLMQNMGGGVPIEVIDELVGIVQNLRNPVNESDDF
jgi:hypothetical protein